MTKRIDPLNIGSPSIETAAGIEKGNNSINHIEDTSFCPVCNAPMEFIYANNVPSNICFKHNVNLPNKD